VLEALADLAGQTGAVTVTVEPPGWEEQTAALGSRLAPLGWSGVATVQPAHTTIVDLAGGFDAVLARMRPKGRYNVRLAGRRGVEAERVDDPERAAGVLGDLCAATAARQDIHQPDAAFLRLVLAAVPTAAIHIASVAGEPIAGALVARFAREAIYLYGGSTERYRDRQPSALLHASIMEAAIAAGCDTYDLWGIPPSHEPAHPWYGLRQFKLSLGGTERGAAGAWRWVRRPAAARARDILDDMRRHARRLPARRQRPAVERDGHGDRTGAPTAQDGE
jgi:lipid II:glycine glycyltransferase (peptidoglycan interpeptide bridge formation enzyme)